jgi:hypothetical protein
MHALDHLCSWSPQTTHPVALVTGLSHRAAVALFAQQVRTLTNQRNSQRDAAKAWRAVAERAEDAVGAVIMSQSQSQTQSHLHNERPRPSTGLPHTVASVAGPPTPGERPPRSGLQRHLPAVTSSSPHITKQVLMSLAGSR